MRVDVLPRDEAFAIPDLIRTKVNLLPPGIEEIRTIEIVGLDLQADGGTHVANTREVGGIRVTGYESKGRINKRIRIALDDDAVGRDQDVGTCSGNGGQTFIGLEERLEQLACTAVRADRRIEIVAATRPRSASGRRR